MAAYNVAPYRVLVSKVASIFSNLSLLMGPRFFCAWLPSHGGDPSDNALEHWIMEDAKIIKAHVTIGGAYTRDIAFNG